jgi:methionyl-tRNA formyltransferase
MARIIFMGTPDFAVPSLHALHGAHTVALVVTQPDRPAGRGCCVAMSAVKCAAVALGLEVYQPTSLRLPDALARLAAAKADVIVVAAYGLILRPPVLEMPPHGCVNVHASLLPRFRGAAPIAAALLAGDDVTGISIMRMDAGLDTGPVLAQSAEPIGADDTAGTLTDRLAERGAELLLETLPRWLAGEILPQPQDEALAVYAPRLSKEDGEIHWHEPAVAIARRVRAFSPWPGAFTFWDGRRLKITRAAPLPDWIGPEPAGTVIEVCGGLAVAAGQGALQLQELQLEGKRCLTAEGFVCGQTAFLGARLGARECAAPGKR